MYLRKKNICDREEKKSSTKDDSKTFPGKAKKLWAEMEIQPFQSWKQSSTYAKKKNDNQDIFLPL